MVRSYRDADLAALARIWFEAMAVAMPALVARMNTTEDGLRAAFPLAVIAGRVVRVFERDGVAAGFLAQQGGLLDRLYVDPALHRRGIGTALLHDARTASPAGLRLFTHVANRHARSFYEKHGFTPVAFGVSPPPESEPDVEYRWRPG